MKKNSPIPGLIVSAVFAATVTFAGCSKPGNPEPISVDAFWDAAHHWRDVGGPGKIVMPRPDHPAYKAEQVREIVANILLYQRNSGGWPKNYDMLAILTDEEKAAVAATRNRADATFDNETTHPQVAYLAKAYNQIMDPACRNACLRGLDYMIVAQNPSGGWPQFYPNAKGYFAQITFNDRVTTGLLTVLRDAANRTNGFQWLDDEHAAKARASVERGEDCILACQFTADDGTLRAWGQQHDEKTLKPAKGRAYELPSLCSQDTAEICTYLMRIENPSPEIIRSIQAGIKWLEDVKIEGLRYEEFESTPAEFSRHKTSLDRRVVPDPTAPVIWARMYDLDTNLPTFCGRNGVKVKTFAEVDRDRRTGYNWYGFWPADVLAKDYPAWLKKNNQKDIRSGK